MRDKTIDAALSCPTAANTHGQDRSLRLSFRDPKESSAHCHGCPVRHERLSEGEAFFLARNTKDKKCWCFYGGSATEKITQHTVKAHVDPAVRKSLNNFPANIARQHLTNDFWVTTSLIQATHDRYIR
jgi:hypothetical protein